MLAVVFDGKVFQLLVVGHLGVCILFIGIVAAVNRRAAQSVCVAFQGIETGFEDFFLGGLGQLVKSDRRRVREGSPKTLDALKSFRIVNDDGGKIFVGLLEGLQGGEAAVGQELLRGLRGDIHVRFLVIPLLGAGLKNY